MNSVYEHERKGEAVATTVRAPQKIQQLNNIPIIRIALPVHTMVMQTIYIEEEEEEEEENFI